MLSFVSDNWKIRENETAAYYVFVESKHERHDLIIVEVLLNIALNIALSI